MIDNKVPKDLWNETKHSSVPILLASSQVQWWIECQLAQNLHHWAKNQFQMDDFYIKLNIGEIYNKYLLDENDTLFVWLYFFFLSIERVTKNAVACMNCFDDTINEEIVSLKLKNVMWRHLKTWKDFYDLLFDALDDTKFRELLKTIKDDFCHTCESSPYNQSRFSGRTAKMFTKTTRENRNYIH
jgi:hypothetical protein